MKKSVGLWGLLTLLTMALVMTLVGCDPNAGKEDGLTMTGIPSEYNGKFIYFTSEIGKISIRGFQSYKSSDDFTLASISGGSARIPLWTSNDGKTVQAYSGSDTLASVTIFISNTATPKSDDDMPVSFSLKDGGSIVFSEGSANKAFGDFKKNE